MKWLMMVLMLTGVLFFVVLVYQFTGLKQYWSIKQSIAGLEGERQTQAEREFYALGRSEYLKPGIIAGINTIGQGGLWVWSQGIPHYYATYEGTVYSYYDVCAAGRNSLKAESRFRVSDNDRFVVGDIGGWAKQARTGDFVHLVLASEGENKGKALEVLAYSMPLFIPINVEQQCKN